MREPRVFVAAVLATICLAIYLQIQPAEAGPVGLRPFPTARPTPVPTAQPTLDPMETEILWATARFGGATAEYRTVMAGDCATLAAALRTQNSRMDVLEPRSTDWHAAFGYAAAIQWQRRELRC